MATAVNATSAVANANAGAGVADYHSPFVKVINGEEHELSNYFQ